MTTAIEIKKVKNGFLIEETDNNNPPGDAAAFDRPCWIALDESSLISIVKEVFFSE